MLNNEAAEVFDIRNAKLQFKSALKHSKELPQVENQNRLNDIVCSDKASCNLKT